MTNPHNVSSYIKSEQSPPSSYTAVIVAAEDNRFKKEVDTDVHIAKEHYLLHHGHVGCTALLIPTRQALILEKRGRTPDAQGQHSQDVQGQRNCMNCQGAIETFLSAAT